MDAGVRGLIVAGSGAPFGWIRRGAPGNDRGGTWGTLRVISGIFFLVPFSRRTFRKMGSKCPMCPQGKNDSRKILAVERTARPKYRQDTRRGCTICYTAAVKAELMESVTLLSVVDVLQMSRVDQF